jgi:PTS system nitrogen regulatory IIA component
MNQIAGLLPVSNILLDLDVANKKRIFEQVGLLFENNHGIGRTVVYDSLFAREKLGSTGLGQGIAIPHGRIRGIPEAIGAFVRTRSPIPFDSPDGRGVTTIFVLLVPEQATDRHLQILSELAQMFSDKTLREAMNQAPDPGALHKLITAWHPDAAGRSRAAA